MVNQLKRLAQPGLSPWWRHGTILVMVFGFSVLSYLTVRSYQDAPPIPEKVVGPQEDTIFTGEDIGRGQEVFFKFGLMEHGTLWGHGAYLGPDYGADYLHRTAEIGQNLLAGKKFGMPFSELPHSEKAAVTNAVSETVKENRFDPATRILHFSDIEVASFSLQVAEWGRYFSKENGAPGLPKDYIKDPNDTHALTCFFAWASWASATNRPGEDYTYTNNFPVEPLVGNRPSTAIFVLSAISLVFLLGGLGLILFFFGKFDYLGWGRGGESRLTPVSLPISTKLTPSQWSTGAFFVVVVLLFLGQTMAGAALAHYRIEPNGFYGFDLARWLPWTILRTWHLQLAIFWIATAWVAGGLFLVPMVSGFEPKGQRRGAYVLLGALAIVVVGSVSGEYLGINDLLGKFWFWFGHQGSEYLDLGRFWQLLLAAGLGFWLFMMFRALKPAMKGSEKSTLASLFLYSAAAIPLFYVPALFYGPRTNFAIIDNWRFWIIHLWVEGFFELFATVLVAVIFAQMGLVTTLKATRVVYLDAILYLSGGLIGTAHHWYFTGQPMVSMALGSCFSALEVVPLTLLTLDAWDFVKLTRSPEITNLNRAAAKQKWAIYFLMAVGVWNFVGAGVFGFLINLPIVSYFEVGTTLTPNHGHAAMFGVFGMLALGIMVFCLREMQSDHLWEKAEKFFCIGFWGLNIGLGLMVILDLFPAGILQLWDSISHGYWHARRLVFTMDGLFHTLEWVRIVGDLVFLLVGVVPITVGTLYVFWKRDGARVED